MAPRHTGAAGVLLQIVLVTAALGTGCTVNPSPEPPSLNPGLVRMQTPDCMDPGMCSGGEIGVLGEPGAAAPGSNIWIVNFNLGSPPALIPVEGDGSFEGVVPGGADDHYRIQARQDGLRTDPLDVTIGPDGTITPDRIAGGCVFIEPDLELELPGTPVGDSSGASIAIRNGCAGSTSLSVRLRVPTSPFSFSASATTLDPAAAGSVDVTFSPPTAALHEEILFLDLDEGTYPITVIGEGT